MASDFASIKAVVAIQLAAVATAANEQIQNVVNSFASGIDIGNVGGRKRGNVTIGNAAFVSVPDTVSTALASIDAYCVVAQAAVDVEVDIQEAAGE